MTVKKLRAQLEQERWISFESYSTGDVVNFDIQKSLVLNIFNDTEYSGKENLRLVFFKVRKKEIVDSDGYSKTADNEVFFVIERFNEYKECDEHVLKDVVALFFEEVGQSLNEVLTKLSLKRFEQWKGSRRRRELTQKTSTNDSTTNSALKGGSTPPVGNAKRISAPKPKHFVEPPKKKAMKQRSAEENLVAEDGSCKGFVKNKREDVIDSDSDEEVSVMKTKVKTEEELKEEREKRKRRKEEIKKLESEEKKRQFAEKFNFDTNPQISPANSTKRDAFKVVKKKVRKTFKDSDGFLVTREVVEEERIPIEKKIVTKEPTVKKKATKKKQNNQPKKKLKASKISSFFTKNALKMGKAKYKSKEARKNIKRKAERERRQKLSQAYDRLREIVKELLSFEHPENEIKNLTNNKLLEISLRYIEAKEK
eukprot:snap_masked-scaffold_3-processed-gene-20.11-mRNA-1 protein AED:1.00 eAED:1.00 QI:0/0/0/0/1/1/2/0/424